jgi:FAD/FMN-containing dehydrogenase
MAITPDPGLLDELTGRLSGRVLRPVDDGYEAARRVHNGLVDRAPAVIVRCRSAADVAAGVRFARVAGLDICVRGGGHNVGGRAVVDDAVMIDLAEMKGISVDPQARTVRAEGGVTWGELNAATAEYGLAVTGGLISTTGIAGLTLGGGLGWLMAKHGLAADNLVAVELVNADGDVFEVSEATDPDLFWALRGGGGNFGVATTFTYRLHSVEGVTGGLIAHPIEAAPQLLRFYRDALADCPDDLTVLGGLVHAPDGSGMKLAAWSCATRETRSRPRRTWRGSRPGGRRWWSRSGGCRTQ